MIVCCNSCGRDVKITERSYRAHPHMERYCWRCSRHGASQYGDTRKPARKSTEPLTDPEDLLDGDE